MARRLSGQDDGLVEVRLSSEVYQHHIEAIEPILDEFKGKKEYDYVDLVIRRAIDYVGDLPASEYHHHSGFAGLMHHMLDVSIYSLQMMRGRPVKGGLQGVEKHEGEKRWIFAGWFAGFMHDIGKVFSDIEVVSEKGLVWNPYVCSLSDWFVQNNVKRYRSVWRSTRYHNKHESRTVVGVESVTPPAVKGYLAEYELGIYEDLLDFFAGKGKAGYVADVVKKADGKSIEEDMATAWMPLVGERKSPVERTLINGFRRLVPNWKINQVDGRLWVMSGDVYIAYPKAFDDLIALLAKENVAIPMDSFKLLTMFESVGWLELPSDGAVSFLLRQDGADDFCDVVKFKYPGMLFDTSVMPDSVGGMVKLYEDKSDLDGRMAYVKQAVYVRGGDELPATEKQSPPAKQEKTQGIVFDEVVEADGDYWEQFIAVIKEGGYTVDGGFLIAADNGLFVRWPDIAKNMMLSKGEIEKGMSAYFDGWIRNIKVNGKGVQCIRIDDEWKSILLEKFGWDLTEKKSTLRPKKKKRARPAKGGFMGLVVDESSNKQSSQQVSRLKESVKVERLIHLEDGDDDVLSFYRFVAQLVRSGRQGELVAMSPDKKMMWLDVRGLVAMYVEEFGPKDGLAGKVGRASLKQQSRKSVSGFIFAASEVIGKEKE